MYFIIMLSIGLLLIAGVLRVFEMLDIFDILSDEEDDEDYA